jgi:hypothetical protein
MANYHYIIAGLPDLVLDFESSGFDFDSLQDQIVSMSSPEDSRCIEWLLLAQKEEYLNHHFYRAALKSKNKFIREYLKFDLELRNIQAAFIARKNSIDISEQLVGENEFTDLLKIGKGADFGLSFISEGAPAIIKILENENILEREQLLDNLRWNKANEICTFNYFDLNVILSFLLKASIVSRWNKLDRKRGAQIFRQLVNEVKGTYKSENNY